MAPWYFSSLSTMQRTLTDKYCTVDFYFWVKYGSWSWCSGCQSYFFNDKYFKEKVSREFEEISVPGDPVQHEAGSVGVSSRWWYLAGMYRPVHYCGRCIPPEGTTAGEASLVCVPEQRSMRVVDLYPGLVSCILFLMYAAMQDPLSL